MLRRTSILVTFLLLIFLLTFTVMAEDSVSGESWDYDMYEDYDVDSFKDYDPANEGIDFDDINYKLLNAAIFYETNRMRIENNKTPFEHSIALEKASQMHSEDMVKDNFFSHYNNYDRSKYTPFDRMALFNVDSGYRAENIATTFGIQYESGTMVSSFDDIPPHTYNSCAEAVVDSWMHSPGHRANILNPNYFYLGCGAYDYFQSLPQFKATQCFGSVVPE